MGCLPSFVPPQFYYTHNGVPASHPDRVIQVYISQEISFSDTLEIQRAIDQWNYALNGHIDIQIVSTNFNMDMTEIRYAMDHGHWIIQQITKDNSMVPAKITHDNGTVSDTAAFVNHVGGNCMYLVRDSMMDSWVYGVTLHEMGHLLGAQHNGKLLMAPIFNAYDYQCIDRGTMEQVANYLGLSMDQVNYCKTS